MVEETENITEKVFHNAVREYIISILLFLVLYMIAYAVICYFKQTNDKDDELFSDEEDAVVFRISLWSCTFTLASSMAAVLLLPVSIVSNEIKIVYPNSYYMQWLNESLIHGLWNHVFLFSNVGLFIMMPFAYFLTESEGFTGSKKGIMARIYEAFILLLLMGVLVCGIAWVVSALMGQDKTSQQQLWNLWNFYLPFVYTCISLLGSLFLLVSTPIGFTTIFTVFSQLVVKPKFLQDLDQDLYTAKFEEDDLKRKIKQVKGNGVIKQLQAKLVEVQHERIEIEKRRQASAFQRNFVYPVLMLLLLALTGMSVLMVAFNCILLLVGEEKLPIGADDVVLGMAPFSTLGPIWAGVQITIILYFMLASVIGFYSIFTQMLPHKHNTTMTRIIGNCVVIVVLSSALPVLSRTLGITYFDLMGEFGRLDWLGNFKIIVLYNMIFASSTAFCLFKKVTSTVRRELINRLGTAFRREKRSRSVLLYNNDSKSD